MLEEKFSSLVMVPRIVLTLYTYDELIPLGQATQGGGGWPMSVFLTPELKPFVGGTYFPPEDSFGRPGFATILQSVAEKVCVIIATIMGVSSMQCQF